MVVMLGDKKYLLDPLDLDTNVLEGLNFIDVDLGVIRDPEYLCFGVWIDNFSFFGFSGEFDIDIVEHFDAFCIFNYSR
jgi:hypothetical protein